MNESGCQTCPVKKCNAVYRSSRCAAYRDKCGLGDPKTNADSIRAMSDEELADFFFESPQIEFTVCEYCQYFGGHTSDTPCKHDMGRCLISAKNEAFKKWLKLPVETEPAQNTDTCVCCGAIIPEGQMVCPNRLVAVKEG